MRDVKVCRVYNLVDNKGNKLQLRLGVLKNRKDDICISNADKGYRWSFIGEHIPMPVRSMTWFNGFPEEVMLNWLKGNGWYPQSCVDMYCGKCRVYELPKAEEVFESQRYQQHTAREMYNDTISIALEEYMKKIKEAKENGKTGCYIHGTLGKPPVEAIKTLMDAGYDIVYHSYGNGYGDWFVKAHWGRSCEKGKIFVGDTLGAGNEVTIDDYKNA